MPIIRIGGVVFVAALGILILKDKMTPSLAFGLFLAVSGIALMATAK
jgi:drug/metabolite transporter (DMT)-like permease